MGEKFFSPGKFVSVLRHKHCIDAHKAVQERGKLC